MQYTSMIPISLPKSGAVRSSLQFHPLLRSDKTAVCLSLFTDAISLHQGVVPVCRLSTASARHTSPCGLRSRRGGVKAAVVSDEFFPSQSGRHSSLSEADGEVEDDSDSDHDRTGDSRAGGSYTERGDSDEETSQPLPSEDASFVQEYKLSEGGHLTTIRLAVGGRTRRTKSAFDRALAHLILQAQSLQKVVLSLSIRNFIRNWGKKKKPGSEDIKFNMGMYEAQQLSSIYQWTATELTLQRAQMVRIAQDTRYLVWAFTLFGVVRILEAFVAVFVTSPPSFRRAFDAMNALDPLTVASLAHAMRQPIVGMLDVDPKNLDEVNSLKAKFWTELHRFYERQWKVMATLGVARLMTLIATNQPSAQWVTSKLKVLWDISLMLPIF